MSVMMADPTLQGPALEWPLWGTTVRLVTSSPAALRSAKRLLDDVLAHVEQVAGDSRDDPRERRSELSRLPRGRTVEVSATLAAIAAAALEAEPDAHPGLEVDLERRLVTVAAEVPGAALALGEVARAWAVDRGAQVIAAQLDVSALVSIGGDIATAAPPGPGGWGYDGTTWEVLVQSADHEPAALVAVPTGAGVASVLGRGRGDGTWSSACVVAPDCVTAGAVVRRALAAGGPRAAARVIDETGLPARLVGRNGRVVLLGAWPEDAEVEFAHAS